MLAISKIIISLVTSLLMFTGTISGVNLNDTVADYENRVSSLTFFENTTETAVPATSIYDLISEHFAGELPEGKSTKKAIIIGYDGCRLDVLTDVESHESSAIATLLDNGGKARISYAGGKNYPELNVQRTETAPGWCSMLTGKLAGETGVSANYVIKTNLHKTLLTTLVENRTISSSAFYTSWLGHFAYPVCTYYYEKQYVEKKNLDVNFCYCGDDDGTYSSVTEDLAKEDCSDFILSIIEYTDHEGHSTGYSYNNDLYRTAFENSDKAGDGIISAIKSRPSYNEEDWLIIITSDHGGYNTKHGSCTEQERYTFIVTNK